MKMGTAAGSSCAHFEEPRCGVGECASAMFLQRSRWVWNKTLKPRTEKCYAHTDYTLNSPLREPTIKRRYSHFGPEGLRESPGGCKTIPLFRAKSAKRPDPPRSAGSLNAGSLRYSTVQSRCIQYCVFANSTRCNTYSLQVRY